MKEKCDIFVDGLFVASATDLELDDLLKRVAPGKDYKQIASSMGGYSGHRIYFSENELKAHVVAWKTFSGFTDKNGDSLYYEDEVIDKDGREGFIKREIIDGWKYLIESKSEKIRYSFESIDKHNGFGHISKTLTPEFARTLTKKSKC